MNPNQYKKNKFKASLSGLASIPGSHFLLFVIWPFAVLYRSLRDFRTRGSKTLFWLFWVYFGFVFVYADPFTGGADSARYAAKLIKQYNEPFLWAELLGRFYNTQDGVDIYQPLVTWIVSKR